MILDCSSLDTTLSSLEPLLGMTAGQIRHQLLAPEFNPANEIPAQGGISSVLLEAFPRRADAWPYTSIAWFHLTRTSNLERYRHGLKPVTHVVDQIWSELKAACDNEGITLEWQDLRDWVETKSPGRFADLYRRKQKPGMQGPYGMLLLESAMHKNPGDNHYLRCPETVEDICKEVEAKAGIGIIDAYQKNTRPAVVKFLDQKPCEECVESAIFYAYATLWGQDYDSSWNAYFDGEGISVPANMVVSAGYIDSWLGI